MAVQIQIRRGDAADWTSADPTLAEGELGVELDTGKFKIGNGVDEWTALSYAIAQDGADGATWLFGAVDPTTEGGVGDFYFNTTSNDVFTKTSEGWGSAIGNLKGADGEEGDAGAGVAPGGTAGQVLIKIDGTDYNTQWATLSESGFGEDELFQMVRKARWI